MARIRTIKPEFPQAESMGRVSRDARLTFVLLWTLADDDGRSRASSRLLASLLYPYDDDAASKMDGWLAELEAEDCIRRYVVDGETYLYIPKWADHQRIDHPTASKLPAPPPVVVSLASARESSRVLAPRAPALEVDLGPGRDLGKDRDQQTDAPIGASAASGNGTEPTGTKWQPFYDAVSDSLGGVDVMKRTGTPSAAVAKLAVLAGRYTNDDVGAAVALWRRYAASDEWQFRRRALDKLHETFGPWADEWARFDVGVQR